MGTPKAVLPPRQHGGLATVGHSVAPALELESLVNRVKGDGRGWCWVQDWASWRGVTDPTSSAGGWSEDPQRLHSHVPSVRDLQCGNQDNRKSAWLVVWGRSEVCPMQALFNTLSVSFSPPYLEGLPYTSIPTPTLTVHRETGWG